MLKMQTFSTPRNVSRVDLLIYWNTRVLLRQDPSKDGLLSCRSASEARIANLASLLQRPFENLKNSIDSHLACLIWCVYLILFYLTLSMAMMMQVVNTE